MWSRLLRVGRIAFDKTGTLTAETIQLMDRAALRALSAEETESLGQLVSRSVHPLWAAVLMPLSSLATLGLVLLFLRRRGSMASAANDGC